MTRTLARAATACRWDGVSETFLVRADSMCERRLTYGRNVRQFLRDRFGKGVARIKRRDKTNFCSPSAGQPAGNTVYLVLIRRTVNECWVKVCVRCGPATFKSVATGATLRGSRNEF